MFTTNPFSILAETVPPVALQSFVIVMVALVIIGTLVDIIHKKNVKYFFENAKKAKLSATKTLSVGEKISVISKTIVSDIATTSELGAGKRRVAHLLRNVWNNFILDWIGNNDFLLFHSLSSDTPSFWPIIWHVGAIMTVVGGSLGFGFF